MKDEKKYFLDDAKNIKRLMHLFYLCCAILVVLDFVIHRHTMLEWEKIPAFYPIFGFVGCVVLVFVASWLRTFLMRPEDYYDKPIEQPSNHNSLAKEAVSKKGTHHVDD